MASTAAARADGVSTRGTVLLLLIAVIALFILVVTYGWLHLLIPVIGEPISAGVFALLLTLIALLLARYIGDKRAIAQINQDERATGWMDWAVFIPFLLLISALGTTNSAFYRFQGAAVLQDDIDTAQRKLRELEGTAAGALGDAEFKARQQRLTSLLASLRQEVVSRNGGNYCGVGSNALAIIRDIQVLLPDFRVPAGTMGRNRCDQIDEQSIYDGLEQQAIELLDATADPLLASLRRDLTATQLKLRTAEERLIGTTSGQLDEGRYRTAQEALKDAATEYADVRTQLAGALPPAAKAKLPPEAELDFSRSLELGSLFSLIPTLLSRAGEGSTWFYILTGIALDFALVYLFGQVALAARNFRPAPSGPPMTDPQFLWVNPAPQAP